MNLPQHPVFWLADALDGLGCIVVVVAFLAYVAFLAAASRVLTRVSPENRRMEPGQVWVNVLPVVNVVWMAVMVERVGESIRNEFVARGRDTRWEGYGKSAGITSTTLGVFGLAVVAWVPPIGLFLWVFALVYGVVYWAQLGRYARRLRTETTAYTPPADEGW